MAAIYFEWILRLLWSWLWSSHPFPYSAMKNCSVLRFPDFLAWSVPVSLSCQMRGKSSTRNLVNVWNCFRKQDWNIQSTWFPEKSSGKTECQKEWMQSADLRCTDQWYTRKETTGKRSLEMELDPSPHPNLGQSYQLARKMYF